MKKTVRRRHNKDGTVTKTTTYRHKNIFGTTVSDTYTEQIEPKPRKKVKSTNSAAAIILVIALCVIPMVGSALNWRGGVLEAYMIAALILFAIYMMISNIMVLRKIVTEKLMLHIGKKTISIEQCSILASILVTLIFFIIGGLSKERSQNMYSDDVSEPIAVTMTAENITETVTETVTEVPSEDIIFPSDEIVNRFIIEYNAVAEYPITNISKGNIVTKGIAYSNGCHMEIINANDAGAEAFCISIDAGNNDSAESHMIVVVRDIIKVLEPDLSEDEIDSKISELEGSGHTDFKVSNDLIIKYYNPPVELSYGMSNGRADIYSYNYK